jgi:hypothetical protein
MNTSARNPPRFLPTLTEVLDPASLNLPTAPLKPDVEQLVQAVLQRVDAALVQRLREELEPLVRQLVTSAMESEIDHHEAK